MKIDLHMHSAYSDDGEFTPRELIEFAHQKHIDVVALSDHNCVLGVDEMIQEAKPYNIQVIPAVECDTKFEGYEVHVLAYGIDYFDAYYAGMKDRVSSALFDSTRSRFELFEKHLGITLDIDRLVEIVGPSGNLGDAIADILDDPRYQVVEELKPFLKGGSQSDARIPNMYWAFCSKGCPCYIDIKYPALEDVVSEIHRTGGIAILAHPWNSFYQQDDLLHQALAVGIDGIEAYSNYHNAEQNAYYDAFCKKVPCLMSCGSDFHGETKPKIELGTYGYERDDLNEVYNQLKQQMEKDIK